MINKFKDMIQNMEQNKKTFEKFSGKLLGVATRYFEYEVAHELVQKTFVGYFRDPNKSVTDDTNEYLILKEELMKRILLQVGKNNITFDVNDYKSIDELEISDDWREINLTPGELINLINTLDPIHKYVFNLSLIDGFSDSKISTIFNIDEKDVRYVYYSAKNELVNKLNLN